ncbi:hypothetical protein SAMN05444000_11757 [Shimia gijangensis]|uniref:DUF2155 domain-containing protein n=1 Tax=Shimia gijangensis TaxID=1470563 RepID=A0A1M6P3N2_9RHOB|nr:DUF2155 domain-containing protein [Shimia gijangensis]SHK02589.1 hypothetical protein SAMN05444000_11757 [Shimia gijangensis]
MIRAAICLMCAAGMAAAQSEITVETLDFDSGPQIIVVPQQPEVFSLQRDLGVVTSEVATPAIKGDGAMLRGLDKLNGQVVDIELENGYSVTFGDLRVDLAECRYPEDNAAGEGYAFLTIYDGQEAVDPLFQGWMVASSPALSALDHARFDIWVLRCKATPSAETASE